MEKLKIATWNISCGIPADWSLSNGIQKENFKYIEVKL